MGDVVKVQHRLMFENDRVNDRVKNRSSGLGGRI